VKKETFRPVGLARELRLTPFFPPIRKIRQVDSPPLLDAYKTIWIHWYYDATPQRAALETNRTNPYDPEGRYHRLFSPLTAGSN
jgi:hypothetical protein